MRRPLFTLPIPQDLVNTLLIAGYKTYQDLLNCHLEPHREVIEILGSGGYSWSKFQMLADPVEKINASTYQQIERDVMTIPTFSEALDYLLGSGVPVKKIIQLCGPPSSGKTQLVMQLCLNVQIPVSMGGLNSSAVFIDSERGFTKQRFSEMADATLSHCKRVGELYNLTEDTRDLTIQNLLDGVKYLEVTGHFELMASINLLEDFIDQNKIKLVVIDSIAMPLLSIKNTLDRTRFIIEIFQTLQKFALQYSISVIIVNDLTTWISNSDDKALVPLFGESMSHISSTILLLAKHSTHYSANIYKSANLAPQSANFMIQVEGVRDIKLI